MIRRILVMLALAACGGPPRIVDQPILDKKPEPPPTVVDWTDSAAIKKPDRAGKMTNTLAIEVGKDQVRFLVNGTEVTSADASKVDAAGIPGLRVNHNLNLHVEGFGVKPR